MLRIPDLDLVVVAEVEVESVVPVDGVLQAQDGAHLVDNVVARLVETPPKLLGELQLETGLRDSITDRQAVAQVSLGVEGIVAAPLVPEGGLHLRAVGDFPAPEPRRDRHKRLHTVAVVEELVVAVVVVQEVVGHPDLDALLPEHVVRADSDLGAVIVGEVVVETQLTLRRDMPPLENLVVILDPHKAACLEGLGPRARAHPCDGAE